MKISDYIVYLWMFPVVLQILFPLVLMCGWMVIKLPFSLFGLLRPTAHRGKTVYAR